MPSEAEAYGRQSGYTTGDSVFLCLSSTALPEIRREQILHNELSAQQ